jgi:hypothetical protein
MKNNTLYDICHRIGEIEEKLMYGEIEFSYDKLMSAMKCGHPAEILDDVLSIIGWDVFAGKEPPIEKVEETLEGLKTFQATFKVNLKGIIKDLNEYLNEQRR